MLSQKYGIIESNSIKIMNIESTYVTPFYPVIVYLIFMAAKMTITRRFLMEIMITLSSI